MSGATYGNLAVVRLRGDISRSLRRVPNVAPALGSHTR